MPGDSIPRGHQPIEPTAPNVKRTVPRTEAGEATPEAAVTEFSVGYMRSRCDSPWRTRYGSDQDVHRAEIRVTATFRDFVKLGEVSRTLLGLLKVENDHLNWQLTDETRCSLRSESRKSAMLDAIRTANEYAHTIGRKVDVAEVNDTESSGYFWGEGEARLISTRGVDETQTLDVTPQDIQLSHHVAVTFRGE